MLWLHWSIEPQQDDLKKSLKMLQQCLKSPRKKGIQNCSWWCNSGGMVHAPFASHPNNCAKKNLGATLQFGAAGKRSAENSSWKKLEHSNLSGKICERQVCCILSLINQTKFGTVDARRLHTFHALRHFCCVKWIFSISVFEDHTCDATLCCAHISSLCRAFLCLENHASCCSTQCHCWNFKCFCFPHFF